MSGNSIRRVAMLVLASLVLLVQPDALAERLPIRQFTMVDGLPGEQVHRITRDAQGYLWFLTDGGLCRFDGRSFATFGTEHGLPATRPREFLHTRDGLFLVAAGDGVYWHDPYEPADGPLFRVARPASAGAANPINALFEDRQGRIWCGTHFGLYRMHRSSGGWRFEPVQTGQPPGDIPRNRILHIVEDGEGSLWFATPGGLLRLGRDGSTDFLTDKEGLPRSDLYRLAVGPDGRIWAASGLGIAAIETDVSTGRPVVVRTWGPAEGLSDPAGMGAIVRDLVFTPDGMLWAGSFGLSRIDPDAHGDKPSLRLFDVSNGLPSPFVMALTVDSEGNLWAGTAESGVFRLARDGLVGYGREDGLRVGRIRSFLEDESGMLSVLGDSSPLLHTFDGQRFDEVKPALPESIANPGWGSGQISFPDHAGEWWFSTFDGLVRFPSVRSIVDLAVTAPIAHYTTRDGLLSDQVFKSYEDSHGDLWLGTIDSASQSTGGLQRWERGTESFRTYGAAEGVPADIPTAFQEDRAGNLWVGFYTRGVGRFRDGRFTLFEGIAGAPGGYVWEFHLDVEGRLWIATGCCGALRVADPDAETPEFDAVDTRDGLVSNSIMCITDDELGRLYFGSSKGVDRFDPATGRVQHYSREEGLLDNWVHLAHRDRQGVLWFGTSLGVSRLEPAPDGEDDPPSVHIRELRVAGVNRELSPFGETDIPELRLTTGQREVEVGFSGLSLASGRGLLFQYRLDGGEQEWSAPTSDGRVHLASLAPGRYRFRVRAVNENGVVSAAPASLSFRIPPPFWQRWWFVSGLVLLVAAAGYAAHRLRLGRAVELERIRTRIATDLHDDIGASLSQVSILSEVVRQQVGDAYPGVAGTLSQIAGTARHLVDSMSDIVWAINPKRDRANDLVQRMRSFASDTFSAKEIAFRFNAPSDGHDRKLGIELRRQVFLIFKEAVNNVVRHSGCSRAEVSMRLDNRRLVLAVADNGRGIDPAGDQQGHGLVSMRERARSLGGSCTIESASDSGTSIHVQVPL